ncbi:Germin-like protein [Rhynchospora pubera]|uniref:Germin-like protein n=1 Tax=Rhynchospora pubera TaxID=906938 RepID=A0AAV8GDR6_9POAL|nr:Germin-like protein [Rhynchospora pubera]KAJ4801233.1 Germin-like protein [Rhynchospora pubera]
MAPLRSLLLLSLAAFLFTSCRADPDPLQDFCVADFQTGITIDGFPCKPASNVVSDDFFFRGLAVAGNTNNMFGSNITAGNVQSFPGLNTLGLSINRGDFAPGGVNPLHSHPRASEIVFVIKGELLVGFISTANVFYSKVLKAGESFIIPRGLVHFQYNTGKENAVAITAFDSQLPGVVLAPLTLFGSKPAIPIDVLTKTFQVDASVIQLLMSKFGQATSPYN